MTAWWGRTYEDRRDLRFICRRIIDTPRGFDPKIALTFILQPLIYGWRHPTCNVRRPRRPTEDYRSIRGEDDGSWDGLRGGEVNRVNSLLVAHSITFESVGKIRQRDESFIWRYCTPPTTTSQIAVYTYAGDVQLTSPG